jgi:hypothetical protein
MGDKMTNPNVADISLFESLQSRVERSAAFSVFNGFQVVVPDLVKANHYDMVKFKNYTKEEAEKMMRGWHNAKQVPPIKRHNHKYFIVRANGQNFEFLHKEDADKVLADAKNVTIKEVK